MQPELEDELGRLGFTGPIHYDSNNAWGFGGSHGVRWHLRTDRFDIQVTKATAYYRHLPSRTFLRAVVWEDVANPQSCQTRACRGDLDIPGHRAKQVREVLESITPWATLAGLDSIASQNVEV